MFTSVKIILGCVFQILSQKNKINHVCLADVFNFLGVKRNTIMGNVRRFRTSHDK